MFEIFAKTFETHKQHVDETQIGHARILPIQIDCLGKKDIGGLSSRRAKLLGQPCRPLQTITGPHRAIAQDPISKMFQT